MANVTLIDVAGWQGGVDRGLPYANIGIAYLASALTCAGHRVSVLDFNNQVILEDRLAAWLSSEEPDLVGLSVKTATMESARRIGAWIKSAYPQLPVLVGGPHATVATASLLAEPWVDYVLRGEGEGVLPELCTRLDRGLSLKGLQGLIAPGDDANYAAARVADLDGLAHPDYAVFGAEVLEAIRIGYPLVTSRGCPYQCTYCSVAKISGSRVRTRTPAHVVDELCRARELYGITGFEVVDDSFNVDMERAKEICRLMMERGMDLSWSCPNGIRADRVDAELATLMVRSGCQSVMVGVESADPELLKTVKKGESIQTIELGISTLQEAGLSVGGFFIIGLPGDSFAAQERSVEFARRIGISAHFNMLVPYPGTEVYDWVLTHGRHLGSFEKGTHFADSAEKVAPVFDTDDFPAADRRRAYEMVHTRLGRFDMVIPKQFTGSRLVIRKIQLLWKYDRPQLLSLIKRRILG